VLVLGGLNAGPMDDAELYDITADTWSPAHPMRLPRYQHSAAMLGDGSVLIAGGFYQGALSDVEIYHP
jgi:hypothetical protein